MAKKDYYSEALLLHGRNKGKWEVKSKVPLLTKEDLSVSYTPGVAEPCLEIKRDKALAYKYTAKQNTVAVVTDGSAVLGLGNIGGLAAIPVMEGKAILFKEFSEIDAVPICLDTQDPEEIIRTVKNIAPFFGGINLEDIKAPECFYIEKALQEALDIPVFHDDQHGTAIVVCAGLINSLKIVHKKLSEIKVAVSGAGAAGTAICHMLIQLGVKDILVSDRKGILHKDLEDEAKRDLALLTNKEDIRGSIHDMVKGRDVFIGVSSKGVLSEEDVKTMAKDSIIFAMSNPEPEIMPDIAKRGGARIVGTGRSDFKNQVNNVLAFPGVFRGALDGRAKRITDKMKINAVYGLANCVSEDELSVDNILPDALDKSVVTAVSEAVKKGWVENE